MSKRETIPIFFTIDRSFAPYLECAVRSMAENASEEYDYKIHVLCQNVDNEAKEKIAFCQKKNLTVVFTEMGNELAGISDRIGNRLRCDYFTLTIYFRLFIAEMFTQYDKGIYIDSDVIIPGDISQLYNLELGENIIGACPDLSIRKIPEFVSYVKNAVGVEIESYVNSGVLLMNLKMMREKKFNEHFLYLFNKYHFQNVAPDQDYINAICKGRVMLLDESWDAMPPQNEDRVPLEKPNIIHYNLFLKPWYYDGIAYREYFWKYAEASPFLDEIKKCKENYSLEQKRSDQKCLQTMLENAIEIEKQDITFKKIYESGEKIRI
ncbi:MAG: glycosyltransferase family 8 protein [Ruminococcus sp.]|nr:glycosyltransferase family 8 protein [Ruminococcus sp.]